MSSAFVSLGVWGWFIAAVLLLIVEVLAPGVFMLWLGLAALIVGTISLAVAWPWQAQFVAFALFALAAVPLWRRLSLRSQEAADQPFLNRRTEGYVGRVFTLERPIAGGVGTVRIDDTVWRIAGADQPAGTRVRITKADGALLMVETA